MFLKIWPSGWLEREKDRTALSPMSSLKQVSTLEGCRHSFLVPMEIPFFASTRDHLRPTMSIKAIIIDYSSHLPISTRSYRSCAVSGSAPEWADQDSKRIRTVKRITSTRIRTVSGSGSRKPDLIHHFWLILLYNQYSKCLKLRANRTRVSGLSTGPNFKFYRLLYIYTICYI